MLIKRKEKELKLANSRFRLESQLLVPRILSIILSSTAARTVPPSLLPTENTDSLKRKLCSLPLSLFLTLSLTHSITHSLIRSVICKAAADGGAGNPSSQQSCSGRVFPQSLLNSGMLSVAVWQLVPAAPPAHSGAQTQLKLLKVLKEVLKTEKPA